MARLTIRSLVLCAAALMVSVSTATAEPIQITTGQLVFSGSQGPILVDFSGAGFTFTGSSSTQRMWLGPYGNCSVPACLPGSTLDLHSYGGESTFSFVTATYQGQTFENFAGINNRSGFLLDWTGSLEFPANFTGGTLSAPFSFSSYFLLRKEFTDPFERVELYGSGIATVTFGPYGSPDFPNVFGTQSVRFDFADVAATPEPASLLLLGTGLCAIAAARRRQTRP